MRRQTYNYFPSRKASPPIGWYQIMLLGDRGTCVLTTCTWLHSTAERLGFKPATCWSQVQHPNNSAPKPHIWCVDGDVKPYWLTHSLTHLLYTVDVCCDCRKERLRVFTRNWRNCIAGTRVLSRRLNVLPCRRKNHWSSNRCRWVFVSVSSVLWRINTLWNHHSLVLEK